MEIRKLLAVSALAAAASLNLQGRIIESSDSKPFKVESVTMSALPGHVVYHPQDMASAVKEEGSLPVLVWVKGDKPTAVNYADVLKNVSANGYVVIEAENNPASVEDVMNWASAQLRATSGEFAGKINGSSVALGGQPSAAVVSSLLQGRSRVRTIVMANSSLGVGKAISKDDMAKFRGSLVYLTGGEKSSVNSSVLKDFNAISSPSSQVVLAQMDSKHGASSASYFSMLISKWLDSSLKNDRNAIDTFREVSLAEFPGSSIRSKNLPPEEYEYPNAHDPVVAFCDGRYYVFTTGMNVMSSADLKHWRFENNVFKTIPEWAQKKGFRGMPWAPDIQYINGMWYIYYSFSGFGKNKSAIGVAVNKTLNPQSPDFKWEDKGMIVESVPGRDEWNAIDANVLVDEDGTGWLVFGSFWRGIKMCRLNEDYTRLADPEEWFPVARRPEGTAPETVSTDTAVSPDPRGLDFDAGNGAIEAPFLFKHDGKYYLFVSFDLCCRGAKSTYNVVVGRADKITGPYYDKDGKDMMVSGGTLVCGGNEQFAGAGHCAVASFDGKDYIFMHGYDKDYDYASKLLIREITWSADGWPIVNL